MPKEPEKTTITISKKLKKKLQELGRMGDTYEDVIWRLVWAYEGGNHGKEGS